MRSSATSARLSAAANGVPPQMGPAGQEGVAEGGVAVKEEDPGAFMASSGGEPAPKRQNFGHLQQQSSSTTNVCS